jgi:5-methylcytosine-specific restriction endonuclease McrA
MRHSPRKSRLLSVKRRVSAAARAYDAAARSAALHKVKATKDVGGMASKADMVGLYRDRLARIGTVGRAVYDEIVSAPEFGKCPLCGEFQASTLDHYLPKAKYPALAVAPANLVPSCKDCNHKKRERAPSSAGDQTIHPYFDDFDDAVWLRASLVHARPTAAHFYVDSPHLWPPEKVNKAKSHFQVFDLDRLYASNAAAELAAISGYASSLLRHSGPGALQRRLREEAASRMSRWPNSWQGALYDALSRSAWYCQGNGF